MSSGKNFRNAIRIAFRFLKHGKLIGPDGLVFVDAGFHVPASEVAAIGTRESAGAKTADRRALPVTVVDQIGELGLAGAGIGERLADASLPGDFRNRVSRPERKCAKGGEEKGGELRKAEFHGASGVGDVWVRQVCGEITAKSLL